jgi:hypothetical protein
VPPYWPAKASSSSSLCTAGPGSDSRSTSSLSSPPATEAAGLTGETYDPKTTTCIFLTAAAIVTVGMLQSATASIHFTNVTDSALNFQLQCEDDTVQTTWTIQLHAAANIVCRNGARAANLRIYTDHSNGEQMVVRSLVYDGANDMLLYENDGDVNVKSVG